VVVAFFCILAGGNAWFIASRNNNQQSVPSPTQPQPTPVQTQETLTARILLSAGGDDHVLVVMGAPYVPGEHGPELPLFLRDGVIVGLTGGALTDWEKMSWRASPGQEVLLIRLEILNSQDVPIADLTGAISSIKKAVAKDQRCVLIVYFP
jgi:hypothetical protein